MAITVTVPALSTDLTTLERLKAELGIDTSNTTDDDVLMVMIDRASSAIARECGRLFGQETVTETLDGSGSRLLGLSRVPIETISEVLEDGTAITDYSIEDAESGALYRANGWGRSGGLRMWGTEAYSSGYILPGFQDLRYQVTYVAGWVLPGDPPPTNLPGALEQACLETVKTWFNQRDGVVVDANAVTIGSMRVQYTSNVLSDQAARLGLPPQVMGMLRQYRRVF